MNLVRTLATGIVAGAAALAIVPASAQTKKALAKEAVEPVAIAKPDQADLDRSQIIGNRELPKVTYIVPWKKPGAGELSRPQVSVLDEALAPVDREVFRRQIRYDAQAVAQTAAGAAPAAPTK